VADSCGFGWTRNLPSMILRAVSYALFRAAENKREDKPSHAMKYLLPTGLPSSVVWDFAVDMAKNLLEREGC
jgi:hypothetical protein